MISGSIDGERQIYYHSSMLNQPQSGDNFICAYNMGYVMENEEFKNVGKWVIFESTISDQTGSLKYYVAWICWF